MLNRNLEATLFAGTCALTLISGSVQADVSVNGIIDVWVGSTEAPGASDSTLVLNSSGMSTSYVGVNATEELGNGLTGVGALQMFYRPDKAEQGRFDGDVFFARAANVGVRGDFGTITGGRNTSPYFLPVVFTNPFADSFVFSPAIAHTFLGSTEGDTGWSDSISYVIPATGGFSGNLVYAFGETEGDTSDSKIGGNFFYRGNGLTAVLAGQQVDFNLPGTSEGAPDDSQQALLLAAAYALDVVTVYGQYQRIDNDLQAGDVEVDTFTAGAAIPAGPGKVLAAYALSDTSTDDADTERTSYALGYDYIVSKRTDVYANYFYDDQENVGTGNNVGVGVRHRF